MKNAYDVILALDVETTCLDPRYGGLLEIGVIASDYDGKELEVFHSYCNPGDVRYEQEALDINHISMEQIKNFTPIEEAMHQFCKFMNKYLDNKYKPAGLLINNAPFDIGFLNVALELHYPENMNKSKWYFRKVDDLKDVARVVMPNLEHMSQSKLGDILKIANPKPHSALGDARQMLEIYLKLMKLNNKRIQYAEKYLNLKNTANV